MGVVVAGWGDTATVETVAVWTTGFTAILGNTFLAAVFDAGVVEAVFGVELEVKPFGFTWVKLPGEIFVFLIFAEFVVEAVFSTVPMTADVLVVGTGRAGEWAVVVARPTIPKMRAKSFASIVLF